MMTLENVGRFVKDVRVSTKDEPIVNYFLHLINCEEKFDRADRGYLKRRLIRIREFLSKILGRGVKWKFDGMDGNSVEAIEEYAREFNTGKLRSRHKESRPRRRANNDDDVVPVMVIDENELKRIIASIHPKERNAFIDNLRKEVMEMVVKITQKYKTR